jgi:hypothetical protein
MNYRNTEMKLDQIVSYLNDEKINLSPAFQRGHVWRLRTRRRLVQNIVQGRPIPAIFLYKEAAGSRYSYNILDGKQRLESLILFIGNRRQDLAINNWTSYFFPPGLRKTGGFWVQLAEGKRTFASLDEQVVRDFREYAIPTIEISLTDESHLDEIINLFVDINQQGVKVSRFDIVKAMGRTNRLLRSVFNLIAVQQRRRQDVFYKPKSNDFTYVLRTLQIVASLDDGKSQVDRMWERLLEIVLFYQSRQHRKPVDILKSFIRSRDEERFPPLRPSDEKGLRKVFRLIRAGYASPSIRNTPLATDQTHFYTLVTALIATDLVTRFPEAQLLAKLGAFGEILSARARRPNRVASEYHRYMLLSSDRTTDTPRREERQQRFLDIVSAL